MDDKVDWNELLGRLVVPPPSRAEPPELIPGYRQHNSCAWLDNAMGNLLPVEEIATGEIRAARLFAGLHLMLVAASPGLAIRALVAR